MITVLKKHKFLLHLVLLISLTALVFKYVEEIENLKKAAYYTIIPYFSSEEETIPPETVDCKSNFQFARLTSSFPKALQD